MSKKGKDEPERYECELCGEIHDSCIAIIYCFPDCEAKLRKHFPHYAAYRKKIEAEVEPVDEGQMGLFESVK